MLNRRDFLKGLGALGAIALINFPAPNCSPYHKDFNPELAIGCEVRTTDYFDYELKAEVKKYLKEHMEYIVPPQYRKYVTYRFINPNFSSGDPLSQIGWAYWKYLPPKLRRTNYA